ncbi:MAG TPA: periplasmic heavy metal sensor [Candidatus Angelobacter sp.]|jgi:Spy/CpxP family protein refolding chaperone|nr:periplasmic heavy metal sensor [Candidatus Angelobacter sp.]
MKTKLFNLFALVFLTAAAFAQQPAPNQDPIGQSFFPPELVMQNQESIGLTEDQKTYLKTELREAQLKFTDWQWKLQDEMERMVALVKQPHVDEQQVLAQLEKVLATEREVKRAQISLLVHIKNKLSAEQQAKLDAIRNRK